MRALVVIPTYNEVDNISEALERVREAVPAADVLVVDDASPDGTGDLVRDIGSADAKIHLLSRPGKSGLGAAYRAGFAWGRCEGFDVMFEMDADLSHDPADLPSLLAAVEGGADLAIGSRYVPGGSIPDWAWHRKALSRWGNRYAGAHAAARRRRRHRRVPGVPHDDARRARPVDRSGPTATASRSR